MKLSDAITKFNAYLLTEKRVSENTYIAYKQDLSQFERFCTKEKTLLSVEHITHSHLNAFLAYLKKRGLSSRSMARKIAALKGLFAYTASRIGIENCAKDMVTPKIKQSLPSFLSIEEIEKLFVAANDNQSLIGQRNKMMLYLMYVTGMRVTELITLTMSHIHREDSFIAVEGKRGRQRLIPVPDTMMHQLHTYIDQVRPVLLRGYSLSDYLFPVSYGKKIKTLSRQAFWVIIKQLWKKAGIIKVISPHTLRHSFATHMLNKGANLRSLQLLLGHEQLATVQTYTHVQTDHLRKIYDKKHPRSE